MQSRLRRGAARKRRRTSGAQWQAQYIRSAAGLGQHRNEQQQQKENSQDSGAWSKVGCSWDRRREAPWTRPAHLCWTHAEQQRVAITQPRLLRAMQHHASPAGFGRGALREGCARKGRKRAPRPACAAAPAKARPWLTPHAQGALRAQHCKALAWCRPDGSKQP